MSEPEVTLRFGLVPDWCRSEIHDDEDHPRLCIVIGGVPICSVCLADYYEGWGDASAAFLARHEWRTERQAAVEEAGRIVHAQESN